ncbi:MAG: tRNA (N(6)-L-threonylcarbamoyladenosine(37)-C(2))-methylthiotransferase MtaB [Sphingobacteriales bacterium UTBCD1]|nr:MAG: tRNA (N(6)-L-threonylcarbamoyladenosine(37)-C(2))-methylthiotransferase MtaB [Sphingobacteriales bacterium UTBCD1]
MEETRTVAFHTLGCKLNFAETSSFSRMLVKDGFEKKEFEDNADVYVINTCAVTENAVKEFKQMVRRIQRKTPESLVVVTGCYAQLKPKEIAEIPGVDLVLGAAEKFNIVQHIRELSKDGTAKICSCDIDDVNSFHSSYSVHDRTRTFLKVQDGCDYNCSYCTIPMARGKSRSDSIENAVRNARTLAEQGVKEIVLTGVNLGDFGPHDSQNGNSENSKKENFFNLIQELEKVEGIERYRISSIEPNLLTNEIIEFVAGSKKFMPHFHIPLQSGSNRILGLMRRRYKRELYAERVQHIKELMPHCCIGVDVIVGFPSETDEDFKETRDFLHSLDISYLHVFTYSERDDTAALNIEPVVPMDVRHQRNRILRNLSFMKMQYFTHQHRKETRKVLFEGHAKDGMMEGYTDNYIKISTPYRGELVNEVVDWMI